MGTEQHNENLPMNRASVLVIDDSPSLLFMLERGLEKHGLAVFTASSGREGLEIFREHPIDVVVCDLGMEGMSGWEVGRALVSTAAEKGIPKVPFLLLTGWGSELEFRHELAASGVDRILDKPVQLNHLVDIIGEVTS